MPGGGSGNPSGEGVPPCLGTPAGGAPRPAPCLRVLVVDDEPLIRGLLAQTLARLPLPSPVVVETAASAEEALGKIEDRSFDAVVSDLRLDGADGIELLAYVARRRPGAVRVLLSAYAAPEIERRARAQAGVAALVPKPWSTAELLRIFRMLLSREERDGDPGAPVRGRPDSARI